MNHDQNAKEIFLVAGECEVEAQEEFGEKFQVSLLKIEFNDAVQCYVIIDKLLLVSMREGRPPIYRLDDATQEMKDFILARLEKKFPYAQISEFEFEPLINPAH